MSETIQQSPRESTTLPRLPVDIAVFDDKLGKFDKYNDVNFHVYADNYRDLPDNHPMHYVFDYRLRPSLEGGFPDNDRRRDSYEIGAAIGFRVIDRLLRESRLRVRDSQLLGAKPGNHPATQWLRGLDRTPDSPGRRVTLAQFFTVTSMNESGMSQRQAEHSEIETKLIVAETQMRPRVAAITGKEHAPGHNDTIQIACGDAIALYACIWALQRGESLPQFETAPLV